VTAKNLLGSENSPKPHSNT